MIKNYGKYFIYILAVALIGVNISGIFLVGGSALWLIVTNIVLVIAVCSVMFLYNREVSGGSHGIQSNLMEQENVSLKHKNDEYEGIIVKSIALIEKIDHKIRPFYSKSGEVTQSISSEKSSDYGHTVDMLAKSIDLDNLEIITNRDTDAVKDIISDVYVKIPYLSKLIENVNVKTEETIINLIDKFSDVSDANSRASKDAEKNILFLRNVHGGKDFNQVAKDSKEAYKRTKEVTQKLIDLNIGNRKKLDKIVTWIKQINAMLNNIQDIAEQNQIIAINSSIEAARIGEAGQGFRVLVQEIQQLNQKTSNFTKEINDIMKSFETYNHKIIEEWDKETGGLVDYMEKMADQEEKVISKFIESFELTMTSLNDLSESTKKVDGNLNDILSSLQYEDITGQQIKHIKEFLSDIHKNISGKDTKLKELEINLGDISKKLDGKVRKELSKKITVIDEKHILDDPVH